MCGRSWLWQVFACSGNVQFAWNFEIRKERDDFNARKEKTETLAALLAFFDVCRAAITTREQFNFIKPSPSSQVSAKFIYDAV